MHQSDLPRATYFHATVIVGCAGANVGSDVVVVVLCLQNVRCYYCMRALLVNVFFAFAAKLHFVCIFTVYLVPPSWLHACSCRRTASKCRFCAYNLLTLAKTVKITKCISSCLHIRPPNIISKIGSISFVKQNVEKGWRFLCFSILIESI